MNLHSAARHSVNSHPGKCHESADETILENDEMGIYLNPGYENFRRAVSAEIYVDKTMMIREINRFIDTGMNYVCMSRPRRFGKNYDEKEKTHTCAIELLEK
jgi:hypothetical protein